MTSLQYLDSVGHMCFQILVDITECTIQNSAVNITYFI